MRKIILPGEKISDEKRFIPYTFLEGNSVYAAVLGMMDDEGRYVPLESVFRPAPEDVVVGVITASRHSGYDIDLNLPYPGFLSSRETRADFNVGDFVMGVVKCVDEVGSVDLADVRRLPKGKIVSFPSAKIPRLIGKKSSMINMIKEKTQSDVVVGKNGYVWISENDIPLVLRVIHIIMQKAHMSGLTDEISRFLDENKGTNA
ncbi:MAG: KH domain-containing protein [Candidatus Micrarchaeota archaeon]